MTATALTFANASGSPWWGTDRGATDEAQAVPLRVTAVAGSYLEAEYGQRIQESRLALSNAVRECSVPDWDGYGAAPANPMSAAWAEKVVTAFPRSLGIPHFSFDPDGEALLEWIVAKDQVLSVSVGADGEIRYAARISGFKRTGIGVFADALPTGLAETACRLACR